MKLFSVYYQPFFIIKIKVASYKNIYFVTENQAAGADTYYIKLIKTLFKYTYREEYKQKIFNLILFFCVINA